MCGIAGTITLNGKKANAKVLQLMLDRLAHRGPSGQGTWIKGSVAFGMRRLSIIDVAGGDQPLYNEEKTIAIIGNGEIYNYKELQTLLKRRGHTLRTGSDIETIAHLYEDEGIACVERLRGMFAFCLYDTRSNVAFIVRDRLGEKPIYWSQVDQNFVFSSEMKAMMLFPGIKKDIDPNSIERFFSFYSIPEPQTAFTSIQKLEAGTYLSIQVVEGKITQHTYWDPLQIKTRDKKNPVPELKTILQVVSKLTLRSDVPVGISLSGGLDSGTVLALAALKSHQNLKAFCVGYAGTPEMDERKQAKELADRFHVECIEKEITVKEMVDHFPHTVFAADDPIADIASYGIYAVAQLAHDNGVPVLLGGVGGDELFWGYPWMMQAAVDAKASAYANTSVYERTLGMRTGKLFFSLFAKSTLKESCTKDNLVSWRPKNTPHNELSYARMALDAVRDLWLKNDCIVLGDRMSMAASVELRLPLVDYKLTEAVYENAKTVTGYTKGQKYFLKEAMKDVLPSNLLNRKKRGFTPPVRSWVYALLSHYMYLLDDGSLVKLGLFQKWRLKIVTKTWRLLPFLWYHLYAALVLELWCRMYVLGELPNEIVPRKPSFV